MALELGDPVTLARCTQARAVTAAFAGDVEWFVNGAPVPAEHDGRFFWQLAPGEWSLKAKGRNGTVEEKFTVK